MRIPVTKPLLPLGLAVPLSGMRIRSRLCESATHWRRFNEIVIFFNSAAKWFSWSSYDRLTFVEMSSVATSAAAHGDTERIGLIRGVVIDQPRLRVEGSGLRGSETEFNI